MHIGKDGNVKSAIFLKLQRLERLFGTLDCKLGAEPSG